MHILVGRAGDIFLGTGNYSYEDNFPTAQFAGQHSLPKEVLGAVLVNRGTALAALVSLINNVRLTYPHCSQNQMCTEAQNQTFSFNYMLADKRPPIPQNSWGLNLMLVLWES